MTNILYIHQSSELYGSDKTLLCLVRGIDKSQYTPIVVLPGEGPLKDVLLNENIKVIVAPVIKLHRKMFKPGYLMRLPFEIYKSIRLIKKEINGIKIDIVHSNTLAVLLGVFMARNLKSKHVWHVHEIITHPKFISNLYPKILDRYAAEVVCNSNATLENLVMRNANLKSKIQVIHNGLDPAAFQSDSIDRHAFGFSKEDIVLSLVGRISRLKGHQLLLKVFNDRFKDSKNVKLLFIGSPVVGQEFYLEELEQKITEFQLADQVKILAFQKDLREIWGVTDISVSPSTEAESFGLVALEAMFSRIPVVATNLGGLKEVVVDNETGYLFENKNEEALGNALQKLVDNTALRQQFGQAGHSRAMSEFTLQKYISRFEAAYKKMTS